MYLKLIASTMDTGQMTEYWIHESCYFTSIQGSRKGVEKLFLQCLCQTDITHVELIGVNFTHLIWSSDAHVCVCINNTLYSLSFRTKQTYHLIEFKIP